MIITETINEYRCTRQSPYDCPTCSGHDDLSARQGYYLEGRNEHQAYAQMALRFPQDLREGYSFDIQLWKTDVKRMGVRV